MLVLAAVRMSPIAQAFSDCFRVHVHVVTSTEQNWYLEYVPEVRYEPAWSLSVLSIELPCCNSRRSGLTDPN
jgi:hypothetical protein